MQSSSSAVTSMMGRKRSYAKASILFVSAVAISLSHHGSLAFQNPSAPSQRTRRRSTPTQIGVVTDPKKLLRMDLDGNDLDRRLLEDLYLMATAESDGLTGEMVEGDPTQTKRTARKRAKIKKTTPEAVEQSFRSVPDRSQRVQFKGLTTGKDGRFKRESLSRTPPRPRSSTTKAISRSSTMPGFSDKYLSSRQQAYEDGIKLAEQKSGMKHKDTAEQKRRRREINGTAMYKSSAAVPDSLVQFANQIHEIERITPTEEVALGEKTQEAIRLQRVFDNLESKLDREPTDEEWCAAAGKINMEALSQAIEEGLEAKNKLVTSNLRMVQGVVNVYIRNGLRGQYNAGDLMQDGIMALIRAAEKFDPTRGFRFSTYAMYWIRSSIKRGQVVQSRVVPVPQRLFETHKRIRKTQADLSKEFGRSPTREELAAAVDMSEAQLERCFEAMSQRCYSLDQEVANPLKPSSGNRETTMYELIDSSTGSRDYDPIAHEFLREDLINLLKKNLSEEEVYLLLLRYGLWDEIPQQSLKNGPRTIAEVSRIVGYKPDKVRRIINRSLKHMKGVIGDEW
eukprot:CAMPEP_0176011724 /NCGR_PEP_ID=MMETSP0120_2-20121206/5429_1 /TAXON_ID=160619 /ORGANISM="Kryptoperidinium foliaceum, Strain CCMP 1326" /LENGTH=565 /DNA_ID=CAMNT_0017344591 /DNA_START=217 /DNA_END=1911 /DNA_ORIENTATION=+